MTVTIRVPSLRSLALPLIGVAVGATLIAPVAAGVTGAANVVPATIYTRSASCAGLDFYPTDSDTTYSNDGTRRIRNEIGPGSGVFRCDPGLPNGAVVTKVQFTLYTQPSVYLSGCAFVRSGLTAATAKSYWRLAEVSTTSEIYGDVRLADTSIDFATINNAKYGYWLECEIFGRLAGIYGANVIYTISSTRG